MWHRQLCEKLKRDVEKEPHQSLEYFIALGKAYEDSKTGKFD